jgi:nucleotide-binding universal stress UspA family protein
MIQIRRILCPTDFSEFSARALQLAIPLARWYEASLTALHVLPTAAPIDGMMPMPPAPITHPGLRARVERDLEAFVRPAREAGLQADTVIRDGLVAGQVLDLARGLPADLLVMGTHGLGGLERLVLGSVTEAVLRKAPCPVLTVSAEARTAAGPATYPRILYATDFSPAGSHALGYALSLAEEAQGTLILVHVMDRLLESAASGLSVEAGRMAADLADDARAALKAAVPPDARDWCQTEEVVVFGRAAEEILRVARERDAQLIVLGVHGRNALDLMLFGSTTRGVVRHAPCPVLVIPVPRAVEEVRQAARGR